MQKKTFTRNEFYDLVWSKPMTTLAKEFSYSDNGLRKVFKKHNIPMPKAGYWSKMKHNKKVKKVALPKSENSNEIITIYPGRVERLGSPHPNAGRNQLLREINSKHASMLVFPEKLKNPDPLIKQARTELKNKKTVEWGHIRGVVCTSGNTIAIEVSKSNVSRALLFMDQLIKLLKMRGHPITVAGETKVLIDGEPIKIRCREVLKRIIIKERYWDRTELIPSGFLSFKIESGYPHRQWQDADKKPLESRLAEIVAYLELKAMRQKQERIEREIQSKIWEEERKKAEDFRRRKETELAEANRLFKIASRWHEAQYIRNYIREVESYAIKSSTMTSEKKQWIQWAFAKADWLDPIIAKEDELLGRYDQRSA